MVQVQRFPADRGPDADTVVLVTCGSTVTDAKHHMDQPLVVKETDGMALGERCDCFTPVDLRIG